jgi:hypothetical protein
LIAEAVLVRLPEYAAAFQRRQPFRHVVIDGFLDADVAARLLAEFPPFDAERARNENGEIGGKAVYERIRGLGAGYAALDDAIQTPAFLGAVSAITGIPDLLYDPHYFGGGTHDNRDGQSLDVHVDFNRHPLTHTHRRLNLIVYLNPRWERAWGGALELHRDPRSERDEVIEIAPLFNRAVIFETTEWSWHGFSRITLPDELKSLSRRSLALYFYTRERPPEESAPTHSTIYVDRPLPDRFVAGHALSAADVDELRALMQGRDRHIQRLYRDVQDVRAQLEAAMTRLGLVRGSLPFRVLAGLRRGLIRLGWMR